MAPVTPVKRLIIGIAEEPSDDHATVDQYGRRGATVAPVALPAPAAPVEPPPAEVDIADLTAEAIRATAEKLISDANATLETAEGILKMLRSDTETFVTEIRRHSGNLAMRLTSYGDICRNACKSLQGHRDEVMRVAAMVAETTAEATAADGKTDG